MRFINISKKKELPEQQLISKPPKKRRGGQKYQKKKQNALERAHLAANGQLAQQTKPNTGLNVGAAVFDCR